MRAILAGLIVASGLVFAAPAASASAGPVLPASTCGTTTDSTAALNGFFSSLAPNTTVTAPAGSCWNVDGTVTIQSKTGLTFDGNHSVFRQTSAPTDTNFSPILQLWLDTNTSVNNLAVVGGYNGSNGNEGNYGVLLEADNGVSFTGDWFANIQGDFVYASPPYDVDGTSDALNKNVTFTSDRFDNGGYHGLSLESVNGFTFTNNIVNNVFEDAIDMEYDLDSTGFNADGSPFWAAQDNVNISSNVWTNWGGSDWFASIQGQAPGVQAQNVTLDDNTLNDNAPFMEVVGTLIGVTTPQYYDDHWTVEGNHYGPGFVAKSYRGGSSAASSIYSVEHLNMQFNTIPVEPGIYFTELDDSANAIIANNHFTGALGTVQPLGFNLFNTSAFVLSNGDPQ